MQKQNRNELLSHTDNRIGSALELDPLDGIEYNMIRSGNGIGLFKCPNLIWNSDPSLEL